MTEKDEYAHKRAKLVENLVKQGIIRSEAVKRAALRVPREKFVPPSQREFAYHDTPLPIGEGQTISAPHGFQLEPGRNMVFMMNELLLLREGMIVFEVGAGSGYHAATIAEVVAPAEKSLEEWGHVYSAEIIRSLAVRAWRNIMETGYAERVSIIHCDGSSGFPLKIKADRILVTAAAPSIPKPLVKQLKIGGRMVLPMGYPGGLFSAQKLVVADKMAEGELKMREVADVAFVPLRGRYGWRGL